MERDSDGRSSLQTRPLLQPETLTLEVDDLAVVAVHTHVGPAPASSGGHQPEQEEVSRLGLPAFQFHGLQVLTQESL